MGSKTLNVRMEKNCMLLLKSGRKSERSVKTETKIYRTMKILDLFLRTKYRTLFAICTFGICLLAHGQVSKEEHLALIDLYESTDGEKWTRTWDIEKPVNEWQGVTIKDGHVTAVTLFMNNLAGQIPNSIGHLKHLVELNLAFNGLNGELPQDLVRLPRLKILKLEMNRIRGGLPENIGELQDLEELSAFNNFLTGEIPSSIGRMVHLKILNLSSNLLKGEIPNTIGNLDRLEVLGLFENALDGSIPRELGNLVKLKELVLANNQLGGEIPKEFGQLASLEVLQIQHNRFDSFENLERIESQKFLVFDYDRKDARKGFRDVNTTKTRMADTKFEGANEN